MDRSFADLFQVVRIEEPKQVVKEDPEAKLEPEEDEGEEELARQGSVHSDLVLFI